MGSAAAYEDVIAGPTLLEPRRQIPTCQQDDPLGRALILEDLGGQAALGQQRTRDHVTTHPFQGFLKSVGSDYAFPHPDDHDSASVLHTWSTSAPVTPQVKRVPLEAHQRGSELAGTRVRRRG